MVRVCFFILLCVIINASTAQVPADRIQYPASLENSFFGIQIGYINYPFTSASLEPGFTAEKISVPHPAVRMTLYGRRLTKHLSAQITYMRPVGWVKYKNINGSTGDRSVWMNVAGLSLQGHLPISKKISIAAEGGLAIVTRKGFSVNNITVMRNACYASVLLSGSMHYRINPKWDIHLSTAFSPKNKTDKQPSTTFIAAGFNYRLTPLSAARIEDVKKANHPFPNRLLMLGYSTNAMGYGVNNAVSKGPVPIFWGGEAEVRSGVLLSYQKNIFRSKKVFAMDWAISAGMWKSRINSDVFYTFSVSPVLKFMTLRTRSADLFLEYSVAGPTYISKTIIDNKQTGRKFTFYDFMGMGVITGAKRKTVALLRIAHFSNGNIFPDNDGVKVPLTFCIGRSF